jgi:diguanylate cyclase (GGDEF)-like protein
LKFKIICDIIDKERKMGKEYKTRSEELVDKIESLLSEPGETILIQRKDLELFVKEYTSIKELSGIDGLSGLTASTKVFNKFVNFYLDSCSQLKSENQKSVMAAFITLDADNFSDGNSIYGHYFMDGVIQMIGKIILGNIRKTDIGARLGGEEFAVIFEIDSVQNALKKAETIKNQVSQIVFENGYKQTISGGIYLFEITESHLWNIQDIVDKAETLFAICESEEDRHKINSNKNTEIEKYILPIFSTIRECSDDALYKAKMSGKNKIELYDKNTDYLKYRYSYANKGKA